MKKTMLPITTFAAGFFIAVFLFGIYSFTVVTPSSVPVQESSKITVQDANKMFKNYYQYAPSLNEPFIGFSITEEEMKVMSAIFRNSSVKACRVYMGADQNKKGVRIIVGVDKSNTDLISAGIYQTPASLSSPCPSICDKASPITKQ